MRGLCGRSGAEDWVKLLFDENLSPKLVLRLISLFPESAHVHDCGLGTSDDSAIWQFAIERGFTIISKDLDFHDRSILKGSPPKVIWLRIGNCSTVRTENLLRSSVSKIADFDSNPNKTLLILP